MKLKSMYSLMLNVFFPFICSCLMLISVLNCILVFRRGSSFPLNTLESVLKQLQKLAPELQRVSQFTIDSLCLGDGKPYCVAVCLYQQAICIGDDDV